MGSHPVHVGTNATEELDGLRFRQRLAELPETLCQRPEPIGAIAARIVLRLRRVSDDQP
jgi:hypothetical protein